MKKTKKNLLSRHCFKRLFNCLIFQLLKKFFDKKIIYRLNNIFIFLLIFFLPTQLGKHFFLPFSYLSGVRVDYLAPTIYLTDIIIVFLTLINIKKILIFLKQKTILLILILLFINVLFSQSPFISIYRYIKIIELLIVGLIAFNYLLKEKLILIAFLISGILQIFIVISQFVLKHSLQGIFYFLGERYITLSIPDIAKASFYGVEFLRPYGTFSHPNSLAGFYLLLYFFVLTNKKFNKFFYLKYLSLFVFTILILISFSKIAILTFLILNTLYLILNNKPICKICVLAKIFTLLFVSLIFLQAQTDPLTINKRLELIKNSLMIISQYPLSGVGIGAYLIAQNSYISKFYYFFNQPVHNIFLLLFAELGIPLGSFIFYQIFILIRKKIFAICYLILAIFITGFFDHYWLTLQQNFLLLGFVAGSVLKKED